MMVFKANFKRNQMLHFENKVKQLKLSKLDKNNTNSNETRFFVKPKNNRK